MTRAVLAERWWIREQRNRTLGVSFPNVYNTGSALAAVGALYASWRQRPIATAVCSVLLVGLKRRWLAVLVGRYDTRQGDAAEPNSEPVTD